MISTYAVGNIYAYVCMHTMPILPMYLGPCDEINVFDWMLCSYYPEAPDADVFWDVSFLAWPEKW